MFFKDVFVEILLLIRMFLRNKGELFLKMFEFVFDFFDGFGLFFEILLLFKLLCFFFLLFWDILMR